MLRFLPLATVAYINWMLTIPQAAKVASVRAKIVNKCCGNGIILQHLNYNISLYAVTGRFDIVFQGTFIYMKAIKFSIKSALF